MKTADATATMKINVHGASWWHRLLARIDHWMMMRRLKRRGDFVIAHAEVTYCLDPDSCKEPKCAAREADSIRYRVSVDEAGLVTWDTDLGPSGKLERP